ncbi:MAG: hypothetical protein QM680_01330 [Luteolibacter sp.]
MVSGDPKKLANIDNLPKTGKSEERVELIGDHSVGKGSDQTKYKISLLPIEIQNNGSKGAYAWWVGGENQKAYLPLPDKETPTDAAGWAAKMQSHSVVNPKPFNLDGILEDKNAADKMVTLRQIDLFSPGKSRPASQQYSFDLSTVSTGLLTNTATGGWRKDLSLFTEKYEDLPTSDLPLFRLTPDEDNSVSKATSGSPLVEGSMLYPWASYRTSGTRPNEQAGAVSSWANLADYALMYRKFGNTNSFSLDSSLFTSLGSPYKYLHTTKLLPVVARLQWVFSYKQTRSDNTYKDPDDQAVKYIYRCSACANPVVTLWNPYNVSLNIRKLVFTVSSESALPVALKYTIEYDGTGGALDVESNGYRSITVNGSYKNLSNSGEAADGYELEFYIPNVGTIAPGGTVVYGATTYDTNQNYSLEMGLGYSAGMGHFVPLRNDASDQIYSPKRANASAVRAGNADYRTISKIKDARAILDNSIVGTSLAGKVGMKLVVREDGGGDKDTRIDGKDANEMVYQILQPTSFANSQVVSIPDVEWGAVTGSGSESYPFMSLVFGLRMLENLYEPGDSHDTNRLAKGFVQTSPTASYTEMYDNTDTAYRVNAAYDYNLFAHSAVDDVVPNSGGGQGYLLSGLTTATGLARCIVSEIPVKPLASLGELQGWDMRFGNPAPPFGYNIIGNSDATPLIASNAISIGNASATSLQYDDSYCANHLLFDDWFFSSINEGSADSFGGGGSLKTNFTEFVTNKTPLVNSAYKPNGLDLAQAQRGSDDLYDKYVEPEDSWRKVASLIEVQGMFNVNSTSVEAWKALLGHARDQEIPYYKGSEVSLDSEKDHAVTRYSVAGDVAADSSSQGVAKNGRSNATQYTGYRVLTDAMIEELAEKIVAQIRQRGPFLSLSEFVNRQLSSDKNLAIAGAIQTALNDMEQTINGGVDATETNPVSKDSGYKFLEAARGSSAHGMPGWLRQADLLRPLAPILSARDDTFTIRTYGDARDASGKILATAYCEAVVTRTRNYCDPSETADLVDPPKSEINKLYGRKFEIVSFRWLSKSEI